jgi:hypothetical protein
LYRNRLIRAYLGASRYTRDPDRFTGFDANDNLQMWELRPEMLWPTQMHDVEAFVALLRTPEKQADTAQKKLAQHLWKEFDGKTKQLLEKRIDHLAVDTLVQNLNEILIHHDLRNVENVAPPAWIKSNEKQIGYSRTFCNRAVLDSYFTDFIRPMAVPDDVHASIRSDRAPLHIVNTALNLTSGENLAWQQRKAEPFTVSPFHAGSLVLGYRASGEYGGADGISLGTAVTISGAAASPNMGYHSSPPMSFLLTLFNIRLGSWLGNPGPRGQKSYANAHPPTNLLPLFAEVTGSTNDRSEWVYLSDGGHFENLGLYEMVLRRCHYIVLSDAGADPKFTFEDLGNAIRKIRTDLGVPIDVVKLSMEPRAADGTFGKGSFVAEARIRYNQVDADAPDGILIYIKAGVYSNDDHLPRDIYNYAKESLLFPHEPTSDQFFSESQFESYRALGRHAITDYGDDAAAAQAQPLIPIARTAFDRMRNIPRGPWSRPSPFRAG